MSDLCHAYPSTVCYLELMCLYLDSLHALLACIVSDVEVRCVGTDFFHLTFNSNISSVLQPACLQGQLSEVNKCVCDRSKQIVVLKAYQYNAVTDTHRQRIDREVGENTLSQCQPSLDLMCENCSTKLQKYVQVCVQEPGLFSTASNAIFKCRFSSNHGYLFAISHVTILASMY